MSKVKQWAENTAEKAVDNIIAELKDGQIDLDTASEKTLKVENTINNLILGGLFCNDKISVNLRVMQIEDGVRIHTCIN